MSEKQLVVEGSPAGSATPSDTVSLDSKKETKSKSAHNGDLLELPPLAARANQRMEGALGNMVLRLLRIRKKGPKNNGFDLDAVGMDPRAHFQQLTVS